MPQRLLLLVLLLLLPACTGSMLPPPAEGASRFTILTWNINYGRDLDGKPNLDRVAELIKREQPDLVALQDVYIEPGTGGINQAVYLAELTGLNHNFTGHSPHDKRTDVDSAVLFREKLYHKGRLDLSYEKPNGRRTSLAIGEINRKIDYAFPAEFGSLNLGDRADTHDTSFIDVIHSHYLRFNYKYFPNLLAGTFNFEFGDKGYQRMLKGKGWVDAAAAAGNPQPTYPADNPNKRADYVFYRHAKYLKLIDARVLNEPGLSDHRPLVVVLDYFPPDLDDPALRE